MTTTTLDAQLTAWAESDAPVTTPGHTHHGEAAAAQGRRTITHAGRPSVGAHHARHKGESPRRQVRLDPETNTRLDTLAAQTGRSPSDIMRTALIDYLDAAN